MDINLKNRYRKLKMKRLCGRVGTVICRAMKDTEELTDTITKFGIIF